MLNVISNKRYLCRSGELLKGLFLVLGLVLTVSANAQTAPPENAAASAADTIKGEVYPVDLATALNLVEDKSLSVAQSKKNTEILQNRVWQRTAAFLPNVEGTFTQSKLEGGQQIFGGETIRVTRKTVQPQLSASWTIYPGGRTVYEMLAARRRRDAGDSSFNQTYQEQLALVATDYYKLLAATKQKKAAEMNLTEASEQVKINQAKADIGKGIPLDLSRAETTYAQQKTALIQAENNILLAEQQLLNDLNLDPSLHITPSGDDAVIKTLIDKDITTKYLMDEAINNSPAIKNMDEELKALGYDYKAVRSDLIPSVTLRTYVNGTGPNFDNLARTNFSGVSVNMNLLENMGLQVPLRMQEAKKLIEQKALDRQVLVRNVQTQVMTAYVNSDSYKNAIDSTTQELNSAKDSYSLALGRFKAGYGINLDVLDAQSALATARSNFIQAVLNYNQAQVQIIQAIGLASPQSLVKGISKQGTSANVPSK